MTDQQIRALPEAGPGRRVLNGKTVREEVLRSVTAPDISALTASSKGVTEEHKA